ncbi:MAG: M23 family metallopeptidase [Oscillospiraceae bacterium]
MNKNIVTNRESKNNIIFLQLLFCAIFLALAFGIRIFGGQLYTDAREIFYDKICAETKISLVKDSPTEEPPGEIVSDEAEHYDIDFNTINENMPVSAKQINQLVWPVNGVITSEFGYRTDPFTGAYNMHTGIDIGVAKYTDIVCVSDGIVEFAGQEAGYGNYIIVKHSNTLKTLYAHCDTLNAAEGGFVKQGQVIALVGTTGRSTGPHLHFETIVNNKKSNPKWLLPEVKQV